MATRGQKRPALQNTRSTSNIKKIKLRLFDLTQQKVCFIYLNPKALIKRKNKNSVVLDAENPYFKVPFNLVSPAFSSGSVLVKWLNIYHCCSAQRAITQLQKTFGGQACLEALGQTAMSGVWSRHLSKQQQISRKHNRNGLWAVFLFLSWTHLRPTGSLCCWLYPGRSLQSRCTFLHLPASHWESPSSRPPRWTPWGEAE